MIEHRFLALFCHCAALVGIIVIGVTGATWPLACVGVLVAGGVIIGAGDLLGGGRRDD